MKKLYFKFLHAVALIAGFAFLSAQYSNGYIVLNEGNFGTPNAEVSYLDENNVMTNNIYGLANGGEEVGDVLQSIYFNQDKAFLVVNNSNKIIVTNRSSFVKTAVITDHISQVRYATVADGKLYATNSSGGYVSVHDASTFAYITSIPLGGNVEEIITVNGKVYVMRAAFSSGNKIAVIDPSTNAVINTITLSDGLQSLKSSGTDIYALCSSGTETTVYKIDTNTDTVANSITNTSISAAWKFALDGTKLYIGQGTNIYSLNTDLATFSSAPIFTVPASTGWDEVYGFAAIDGKIFQGNANAFTGPSILNVYNPSGVLLDTYTTTIGINGVYKNVYSSLSTAEHNKVQISIYPNPTSDMLYIANSNAANFVIYNSAGQAVTKGVYSDAINVSGLAKGNYFIQISDKTTKVTKKFIKK